MSDCSSSRDYHIGDSNYSEMKIQPYDIFKAFPELNYQECDIIKRILRKKKSNSRLLDYQKIRHIIEYLIEEEQKC